MAARTASQASRPLLGCDTFVFVGGENGPACTLFGKNSDRPSDEEHEVVFFPAADHDPGSQLKCTHISIPQVAHTLAVVLSRPRWLWGCEMGANELGVVGGNEAVFSQLSDEVGKESRLLGMDLLRLALERGRSAREAADVCAHLLDEHGQGGGCSEDDSGWTYENGFLFADAGEAYVLETAGVRHWALERVGPGCHRNISNSLSIRSEITACSAGLKELCKERGWWSGTEAFDFKASLVFAGDTAAPGLAVGGRERSAAEHLARMARDASGLADAGAWCSRAAAVLRDDESGICFRQLHGFCSTGSQISWLDPKLASHLFTAASDPFVAAYKRFTFADADRGEGGHSLELWKRWRTVALKGGLAAVASPEPAGELKSSMAATEQEALKAVAGGLPSGPESTFGVAVARELKLLGECVGSV